MGTSSVIVARIGEQYSAQMRLAKDDDCGPDILANGPNQSFGKIVLPRRPRHDRLVSNAHCAHPPGND